VENPLSIKVLSGEFKEGATVLVDVGEEGLTFKVKGKTAVSGSPKNQPKEKKDG
jgi:hypothetical protein